MTDDLIERLEALSEPDLEVELRPPWWAALTGGGHSTLVHLAVRSLVGLLTIVNTGEATMTITIFAWIIPTIITIAAFAWGLQDKYIEGTYNFGGLFTIPAAGCISLAAWFIWALLT
jgi:hypothetical protein